jgi:hypothetical protein
MSLNIQGLINQYSPGLPKVYLNASMSSSVTVERSFGLFRLNTFAKAMKSKAESAVSGRYGSM